METHDHQYKIMLVGDSGVGKCKTSSCVLNVHSSLRQKAKRRFSFVFTTVFFSTAKSLELLALIFGINSSLWARKNWICRFLIRWVSLPLPKVHTFPTFHHYRHHCLIMSGRSFPPGRISLGEEQEMKSYAVKSIHSFLHLDEELKWTKERSSDSSHLSSLADDVEWSSSSSGWTRAFSVVDTLVLPRRGRVTASLRRHFVFVVREHFQLASRNQTTRYETADDDVNRKQSR